jgi:hypothetical protein
LITSIVGKESRKIIPNEDEMEKGYYDNIESFLSFSHHPSNIQKKSRKIIHIKVISSFIPAFTFVMDIRQAQMLR